MDPRFRRRSRTYPPIGALLAVGAPIGLFLVRCLAARTCPTPACLAAELRDDPATYAYLLVSTTLVFALLGRVLGTRDDLLVAASGTDALTGLANRRSLEARLEDELRRAERHGTAVSLLLIDVDGLKKINDLGGHEAGDAALRAVAEALHATCRRTDVPARVGGDEFAVLAPLTPGDHALELANRIRASLAALPAERRAPTISVGVTDVPRSRSTRPRDVYAAADRALYRAKTDGRDRALLAG